MVVRFDPAATEGAVARAGFRTTLAFLHAVIENAPAALFVKDMSAGEDAEGEAWGRYVLINRAGERLMRRSRDKVIGKTDRELFSPSMAERFIASDRAALRRAPGSAVDETSIPGEGGRERHIRTRKLPFADETSGVARYVLGISEDITERLQDLDALREQNRLFDAAIKGMSHGLCMVDADERMIVCNDLYLGMFNLDPVEIRPGVGFLDILRHSIEVGVASQSLEDLYAVRKQAIAAGQATTYYEPLSDGRLIAISHRPMPMPQDGPRTPYGHAGWVSIYEDVTLQRRAETALKEQNRLFNAALSNMGQGLCMFDADARVVVYNHRFLELFGLSPSSIAVGQPYRDVIETVATLGLYAEGVTVDSVCQATRAQVEAMAVGAPPQPSLIRHLADGRVLAVLNRPMFGGGWVTTFEDVTELRRSEAQIAHMARHDALTNLPNRTTFQERVEQAVAACGRGGIAAVFYIDLDAFKTVNDTLGHLAGDKLLRIVASRLQACVRDTDLVARLGGDEFAILQVGMTKPADAVVLAGRLLRQVGTPVQLNGHRVRPRMSVGVAVAPFDGARADTLMKRADVALYRAKAEGGHTYRLFEPTMELQLQARRQLETDLHDAMEAQAFQLLYQPLVDTRSNAANGFEALVRWNHPTRGRIAPGEFISVAEETGLIVPLGAWILNRACADAVSWPEPLLVAVNISAAQFKDPGLVSKVAAALRDHGLEPSRLEIEITESVLLGDEEKTRAALHELRAMGIRIAMDDFGTGYSSLSYLRSFPFDRIKIDRSFVQELGVKPEAEAIVRAIAMLATSLGMEITAEGVETHLQLEMLKAQGCTQVQGYLFSPPQPGSEIAAMMAACRDATPIRAVA